MTPKTKTQSQILAAISCFSLLTLAYLSINEVSFGYFSFHLCAGFAFLAVFVPCIILDDFNSRFEVAIREINKAIASGEIRNRKALNIVLDRASKIYSLKRATFSSYDRLIKFI